MLHIAAEEEQKRLAEERAVEAEKIHKIKESKKKANEGKGPKTPKKGDNIETSKKNEVFKMFKSKRKMAEKC